MEVLSNIKDDVTEVEVDCEGNWKIPTPEKEKENGWYFKILSYCMSSVMRKPTMWFLIRSDTNRAVQARLEILESR